MGVEYTAIARTGPLPGGFITRWTADSPNKAWAVVADYLVASGVVRDRLALLLAEAKGEIELTVTEHPSYYFTRGHSSDLSALLWHGNAHVHIWVSPSDSGFEARLSGMRAYGPDDSRCFCPWDLERNFTTAREAFRAGVRSARKGLTS